MGLAGALGTRAHGLERALTTMLGADARRKVLEHPLVTATSGSARAPDYLSPRVFASALLEIAAAEDIEDDALKGRLRAIAQGAETRDALRADLERWFDDSMLAASAWYRRRMQLISLVLGVVVAAAVNADTIQVADSLWHSADRRAAVQRSLQAASSTEPADLDRVAERVGDVRSLQLPLGWTNAGGDPRNLPEGAAIPLKAIGLLFTGFALSLGAPFWFDLMGRGTALKASARAPAPT